MTRYAVVLVALALVPACRGSFEANNGDDAGITTDGAVSPNNADNSQNGQNGQNGQTTPNGQTGQNAQTNSSNANPGDMGTGQDANETPFDAGPCGAVGFGDELTVTPVDGTTAQGQLHAVGTSGGGAVVAYRDGTTIHVTHVDGAGSVVADMTTDGSEIYGLAAHDDGRAVMVSRGSDILALVIFDASGNLVSDQTIIGDVPHDVTNNEWFGPLLRTGHMTWTGSEWATYFSVQRLWDDGIAHYGDQLRRYSPDGSSNQMVWGWGCSHSMEVKVSHNGDRLGPLCLSDCYPSKGVHFNHRGGELWGDESGSNCAGQYGTSLGASVPIAGGFWMAFTATDDRASHDVAINRIDGTTPGDAIWLTEDGVDDTALRAVNFEDDLLVAWNSGATNQFVIVDGATGQVVNGPVTIADAALGSSSDFFEFANGDIGWAQNTSGQVGLVRLRACR